jgi:hypothetical protein
MPTEDFDAIDAVFLRLADRKELRGANSITDIERVVLLVWHASGIIGNGGFQYFFECALSLLATAEAFDRIGVEQCCGAGAKFGKLLCHFQKERVSRVSFSRWLNEAAVAAGCDPIRQPGL